MSVTVRIPAPLRDLAGGEASFSLEGSTVGEVLQRLEESRPGFRERLFDAAGNLRAYVRVFLNADDIRTLGGLEAPVRAGDSLSILPAIAGGEPAADRCW